MDFTKFLDEVGKGERIALTAPGAADGDSVGTQAALLELIRKKYPGKTVLILNEDPCPDRYAFMPCFKEFGCASDWLQKPKSEWPDVVICVDGGEGRIGPDARHLWLAARKRGQVDHHAISGGAGYDFRLYDPTAAATTQIVYRLAQHSAFALTPAFAQAIYLGLIHDTGMFKHPNTTPDILRIAADLLGTGFDHCLTAEKGLLLRGEGHMKMLRSLMANMHGELKGRYCWGVVDYKAFRDAGSKLSDREGLIDTLFLTDNCELSVLFLEVQEKHWRLSLRSRGWNVAALAQALDREGGGHKQAAGCSLEGERDTVLGLCHNKVRSLLGT